MPFGTLLTPATAEGSRRPSAWNVGGVEEAVPTPPDRQEPGPSTRDRYRLMSGRGLVRARCACFRTLSSHRTTAQTRRDPGRPPWHAALCAPPPSRAAGRSAARSEARSGPRAAYAGACVVAVSDHPPQAADVATSRAGPLSARTRWYASAIVSASSVIGFARKSSMPAARQRSRSPSSACAVSAMIGDARSARRPRGAGSPGRLEAVHAPASARP